MSIPSVGKSGNSSVHPSGEEFLHFCNATTADDDGEERFTKCEKLVQETRRILATSSIHGIRACIPQKVSDLKTVFTAINRLDDNPEERLMDSDEVLARALSKSWPCGKQELIAVLVHRKICTSITNQSLASLPISCRDLNIVGEPIDEILEHFQFTCVHFKYATLLFYSQISRR